VAEPHLDRFDDVAVPADPVVEMAAFGSVASSAGV